MTSSQITWQPTTHRQPLAQQAVRAYNRDRIFLCPNNLHTAQKLLANDGWDNDFGEEAPVKPSPASKGKKASKSSKQDDEWESWSL